MHSGNRSGTGRILVTALVVIGLAPAGTGAFAGDETTAAESDSVIEQLAGIRDELRSISTLLAAAGRHQEVTALMTRIRLKQQSLSSIETELRDRQAEKDGVQQEIEQLTAVAESWSGSLDERLSAETQSEDKRQLELLRRQLENFKARTEGLGLRIVELENDLARAREEVAALEETVDERLGLR